MKKKTTIAFWLISLLFVMGMNQMLHATTFTSAQTGYFSIGSTWVGGVAPGSGDDIIISSGHTVTLSSNTTVFNITIEAGATLDNSSYNLSIGRSQVGNPSYTNNGIHNGTGYLKLYEENSTEFSGSGNTNCSVIVRSYGLSMSNNCNLTINGDLLHDEPGNFGMNGKEFISNWQGGNLTVNGNLTTDDQYTVGIYNVGGLIHISGDVEIAGGLSSGGGSTLINSGAFEIGGDLNIGPYSGFVQNSGTIIIGGNLFGGGSGESYYLQEINSISQFGGQVFPADHDGELFAGGYSIISGEPVEPNTVIYNGNTNQTIKVPSSGVPYSNLTISNSNSIATIESELTIGGTLLVKPSGALTVSGDAALTLTGDLILESTNAGTGSLIMNTSVNGTIQRYIPGHNGNPSAGWHFLSSPVSSQQIEFFHQAGSGNDFYKWDESSSSWINRTAEGGNLNPLFGNDFVTGKGYLIANIDTDTKYFDGSIITSDVPVSTLTYEGEGTLRGWNLLGNPYSSAVKWNDGNWNLYNVDAMCQVWDEQTASYNVMAPNQIIPEMNGFMVHANSANASLSIPGISRVHSVNSWYKDSDGSDRIVLTVKDQSAETAQSTIIQLDPKATDGYDNQLDCYFLSGFAPRLYSINGDEKYALNTVPEPFSELCIPLGFEKNEKDQFILQLTTGIGNHPVFLTDRKMNMTVDLNKENYTFISKPEDDPARFLVHTTALSTGESVNPGSISVWSSGSEIYIMNQLQTSFSMTLYDLNGKILQEIGIINPGMNQVSHTLMSGLYLAKLYSASTILTKKIIVK